MGGSSINHNVFSELAIYASRLPNFRVQLNTIHLSSFGRPTQRIHKSRATVYFYTQSHVT